MRTAAGLHPDDPIRRQRLTVDQEAGILLGIDVVGDHRQLVAVAHRLAEGVEQGGLAGTDRAADADSEGVVHNLLLFHER